MQSEKLQHLKTYGIHLGLLVVWGGGGGGGGGGGCCHF